MGLLSKFIENILFSVRIGIADITKRYGKQYTESPKVQYIMNGNRQYKHFDVKKQVDWSPSTQEQSGNSIKLV